MATCIVMPKAGVSVETCIMGEWVKKPGDKIAKNDIVFTYETDKSVFEYRAEEDGVLLQVLVSEGDDVPVTAPVCYIGSEGEDISPLLVQTAQETDSPAAALETASPSEKTVSSAAVQTFTAAQAPEKLRISPRARAAAQRMDIKDYSGLAGSGPNGRIIERDVRSYAQAQSSAQEDKISSTFVNTVPSGPVCAEVSEIAYTDHALSNIRKAIARNMQASLSQMAQLTHSTAFDATEIIEYRKKLKVSSEVFGLPGISLNDMLLFAVSRILPKHPFLNAHFLGDTIRCFQHVHLGMAVDTPRGLMVPTIFNADLKSLVQIAQEAKSLAKECQSGAIDPEKLTGASFTVTNLGVFGMESFTPVINPPQTGILGVCSVVDRVRRTADGDITVYPAMGLSLTYDHRALDGAPASRFLQELCQGLEHFTVMLAE